MNAARRSAASAPTSAGLTPTPHGATSLPIATGPARAGAGLSPQPGRTARWPFGANATRVAAVVDQVEGLRCLGCQRPCAQDEGYRTAAGWVSVCTTCLDRHRAAWMRTKADRIAALERSTAGGAG